MTQLLLFDTPVAESFAPITPATTERVPTAELIETTRMERKATEEHQRGLNHMGDLARLVLLRYDLVAQRRARRLAKEAANG